MARSNSSFFSFPCRTALRRAAGNRSRIAFIPQRRVYVLYPITSFGDLPSALSANLATASILRGCEALVPSRTWLRTGCRSPVRALRKQQGKLRTIRVFAVSFSRYFGEADTPLSSPWFSRLSHQSGRLWERVLFGKSVAVGTAVARSAARQPSSSPSPANSSRRQRGILVPHQEQPEEDDQSYEAAAHNKPPIIPDRLTASFHVPQ